MQPNFPVGNVSILVDFRDGLLCTGTWPSEVRGSIILMLSLILPMTSDQLVVVGSTPFIIGGEISLGSDINSGVDSKF